LISSKTYQTQINALQNAFKQKYTDEQTKRLFSSLQGKSENNLKKAIDWLILNKTRLPFPGEVIMAVDNEQSQEWREKKYKEQTEAKEFFEGKTYKGQMVKETLKIIAEALDRDNPVSLVEHYKKMIEMESIYPGIGWRKEADGMMAVRNNG